MKTSGGRIPTPLGILDMDLKSGFAASGLLVSQVPGKLWEGANPLKASQGTFPIGQTEAEVPGGCPGFELRIEDFDGLPALVGGMASILLSCWKQLLERMDRLPSNLHRVGVVQTPSPEGRHEPAVPPLSGL